MIRGRYYKHKNGVDMVVECVHAENVVGGQIVFVRYYVLSSNRKELFYTNLTDRLRLTRAQLKEWLPWISPAPPDSDNAA